jgi:hypothetical protein
LLPKQVTDVDPIIQWGIRTRLKLIKEVAGGPQASGNGAPGMEEGDERLSPAPGEGLES